MKPKRMPLGSVCLVPTGEGREAVAQAVYVDPDTWEEGEANPYLAVYWPPVGEGTAFDRLDDIMRGEVKILGEFLEPALDFEIVGTRPVPEGLVFPVWLSWAEPDAAAVMLGLPVGSLRRLTEEGVPMLVDHRDERGRLADPEELDLFDLASSAGVGILITMVRALLGLEEWDPRDDVFLVNRQAREVFEAGNPEELRPLA